jgi:hypothetical protein
LRVAKPLKLKREPEEAAEKFHLGPKTYLKLPLTSAPNRAAAEKKRKRNF